MKGLSKSIITLVAVSFLQHSSKAFVVPSTSTTPPLPLEQRQAQTGVGVNGLPSNYWWPYPSGGVYATTTVATPEYQPSTQPIPAPTTSQPPVAISTPPAAVTEPASPTTMQATDTASTTTGTLTSSTGDSSITPPSSTISESSSSDSVIHITAPTLLSETNSPNNPAPRRTFKLIYLTPLFVLGGLVLGVCAGLCLHRKWGQTSQEHASEKGFTRYPAPLAAKPWWTRAIGKLPGLRSKQEPFAFPYDNDAPFNPPALPIWYGSQNEEHEEARKRYGYGEYRNSSGHLIVDEAEHPEPDSSSEDEGDLGGARGWKNYALSDESRVLCMDRSKFSQDSSCSGQGSGDKFTSLPRRFENATSSAQPNASPNARPKSTRSKYLRIPFLSRARSASSDRERDTPRGRASPELGQSGIRRTSAGKKKSNNHGPSPPTPTPTTTGLVGGWRSRHGRETEEFASSPYNPHPLQRDPIEYDSPPPTSALLLKDLASSDEEDLFEDYVEDPHLEKTPRNLDGEIRHKSIRRILAAKTGPAAQGHWMDSDSLARSESEARWTRLDYHDDTEDSASFYPTPIPDETSDAQSFSTHPDGQPSPFLPSPSLASPRKSYGPGSARRSKPVSEVVKEFDERSAMMRSPTRKAHVLARQVTATTATSAASPSPGLPPPASKPSSKPPTLPAKATRSWPRTTTGTQSDRSVTSSLPKVEREASSRSNESEMDDSAAAMSERKSKFNSTSQSSAPLYNIPTCTPSRSQQFPLSPRTHTPLPDHPTLILSPPLQPELFFTSLPSASPSPRRTKKPSKIDKPKPLSKPSSSKGLISLSPKRLHRRQGIPESPLKQQLVVVEPSSPASLVSTTASTTTAPPSRFSTRARAQAVSKVDSIVKQSYSFRDFAEMPNSPTGFGRWDEQPQANLSSIIRVMEAELSEVSSSATAVPLSPADSDDMAQGGIEQRLALLRRMEN